MRKIKFRAWDKGIKEMMYEFDGWSEDTDALVEVFRAMQDSSYILMQFTGLKDKTGREIYEGDILEYDGERCPHCKKLIYDEHDLYKIVWKEDASFACENENNWMAPDIWKRDMKIVGNIYKNPELLTNKEKK